MPAQDDCMEEGNREDHAAPAPAGEAREMRYAAFLLRVWRNETTDEWRLVIEEVGTDARHGFTDWDALTSHARAVLERAPQR